MADYLKLYKTQEDYNAESDKPTVAHIIEDVDIEFDLPDDRLICYFDVISTSSPTPIMKWSGSYGGDNAFTEIEIDGVVQPELVSAYTFSTLGTHVVKYRLKTPTVIPTYSLSSCKRMTKAIIPNTVTHLNYCCFQYNNNLKEVIVPEGVKEFGDQVFGSTGIESIELPSTTYWFTVQPFDKCYYLQSLIIKATTPPILSGNSMLFEDSNTWTKIYVPAESVNTYKTIGRHWDKYYSRIYPIE